MVSTPDGLNDVVDSIVASSFDFDRSLDKCFSDAILVYCLLQQSLNPIDDYY